MPTKSSRIVSTPRDFEILQALGRCPLSTEQLLKVSRTFSQPFSTTRPLRRRMQALASAGWVRIFQYASTTRGVENYYKLTPSGYRLLNGPKSPVPSRGFFRPVSLGIQEHTRSLAEFIVHTVVSARGAAIQLLSFYRENDLRLSLGDQDLLPDCAFQLSGPDGAILNFAVELDNGTEPITSRKERECWDRKIRFYDRFQDSCPIRYRVLIVTARNSQRRLRILQRAGELLRNPQRRLFYAVSLAEYLAADNGVIDPCFVDHLGNSKSLIPGHQEAAAAGIAAKNLDLALGLW